MVWYKTKKNFIQLTLVQLRTHVVSVVHYRLCCTDQMKTENRTFAMALEELEEQPFFQDPACFVSTQIAGENTIAIVNMLTSLKKLKRMVQLVSHSEKVSICKKCESKVETLLRFVDQLLHLENEARIESENASQEQRTVATDKMQEEEKQEQPTTVETEETSNKMQEEKHQPPRKEDEEEKQQQATKVGPVDKVQEEKQQQPKKKEAQTKKKKKTTKRKKIFSDSESEDEEIEKPKPPKKKKRDSSPSNFCADDFVKLDQLSKYELSRFQTFPVESVLGKWYSLTKTIDTLDYPADSTKKAVNKYSSVVANTFYYACTEKTKTRIHQASEDEAVDLIMDAINYQRRELGGCDFQKNTKKNVRSCARYLIKHILSA